MRHRRAVTAALVGLLALPLAGCKQIEVQQRTDSSSSSNGTRVTSVQKVYVVQDGDTLYGIAERECGSGASVRSLAQANIGRKQPDGRVMKDADQLRVGWTLVMSC